MADGIVAKGKKAKRGRRVAKGAGWKLAATAGDKRVFTATLLSTLTFGSKRLAVFSVPKEFSA